MHLSENFGLIVSADAITLNPKLVLDTANVLHIGYIEHYWYIWMQVLLTADMAIIATVCLLLIQVLNVTSVQLCLDVLIVYRAWHWAWATKSTCHRRKTRQTFQNSYVLLDMENIYL